MTVYVDNARNPYRHYLMSHMWADSREELFEMVDRIGLSRRWFQCPPAARWEHFDVSQVMRAKAIARGALQTDRYGPAEHVARLRGDVAMVERIAALRARKVAS